MKYFYFFILNFLSTLRRKLPSNVIYIIISLLIFCLFSIFDRYIFNKIFRIQSLFLKPLEIINIFTNVVFETKTILSALLILLFFSRDKNYKDKILYSIALLLLSTAIAFVLKLTFSRERPYVSYEPYNLFMWKSFSIETYDRVFSLPSGHIITLISTYALWKKSFILLLYLMIVIVALFRVYSLQHWPSDTIASILFSVLIIFNSKDN